ncbi:MAG TPA: response regulator [Longimicrobiales bacterium]|nr:response regulator [Longimicrobiales bacterium]
MVERKILVVDDEQPIRDLFTQILTRAGYQVTVAESGEAALEAMRSDPAWVLFLDLNLPGMNGLELCRAVRTSWPMAVAHAVTGYASLFELSDCRAAGFEDYFTKPVAAAALRDAAARAFEKLDRWKGRASA